MDEFPNKNINEFINLQKNNKKLEQNLKESKKESEILNLKLAKLNVKKTYFRFI